MAWDTIEDHIIWIIGVFFASWQLVEEARKGKRSKVKIGFLFIGIFALCYLGMRQINRNKAAQAASDAKINSLSNQISDIQKARKVDSISDNEFQNSLKEEFKITRDSISNKPVQATYNTQIDEANEVQIGPKN
jgi:hypothetical protein